MIGDYPGFFFGSGWTLRLVFPQPLRCVVAAYQTVVDEELKSPLDGDMHSARIAGAPQSKPRLLQNRNVY